MSYNNLSSVATLQILATLVQEVRQPMTWGWKRACSLYNLEAAPEGVEALYIVALSSAGSKKSEERSFVEQVWFTWQECEVFRMGRKARKENRSFQLVTLTLAETPWSKAIALSPVGGKEALGAEEDRRFGYSDRYTWLLGNQSQEWSRRSLEACLQQASEWRTAADKALGAYPWGACNNI